MELKAYWHVVFTASRAEKKVKERLEAEEVECFLPVQAVVRQWTYRKKKVMVPVIPGMIFVRVTRQEQLQVLQVKGVVTFLKLKGEEGPAVILDKQMKDFRFLVDFSEEMIEIINEKVDVGDFVRVVKGPLKGLEGELVQIRGAYKVAVRIDKLGCAMVDIPSTFVECMGK